MEQVNGAEFKPVFSRTNLKLHHKVRKHQFEKQLNNLKYLSQNFLICFDKLDALSLMLSNT